MIHDIDTNDSTHKKWYNDRYRSSTLKSTLFSAHVHWSQTHFYKINLVFSEAEPACFIVRCLPPPLAYYDRRQRLFTVALVHWAEQQHRKQQSGEVRCDLVTLPADPLERKETDCVTVLVYVVSVITPVVVYCGGWAGEGLACPCLWRAAIILSTRHSPGSWRDQWGQQQSVSNCAIKWVPAVHLIRVLTELQEAGGREEGTVSCGSFQNCLFQHFCCWEFYKGRVNVFISWWNICPAQGPPRSPPPPSRPGQNLPPTFEKLSLSEGKRQGQAGEPWLWPGPVTVPTSLYSELDWDSVVLSDCLQT